MSYTAASQHLARKGDHLDKCRSLLLLVVLVCFLVIGAMGLDYWGRTSRPPFVPMRFYAGSGLSWLFLFPTLNPGRHALEGNRLPPVRFIPEVNTHDMSPADLVIPSLREAKAVRK